MSFDPISYAMGTRAAGGGGGGGSSDVLVVRYTYHPEETDPETGEVTAPAYYTCDMTLAEIVAAGKPVIGVWSDLDGSFAALARQSYAGLGGIEYVGTASTSNRSEYTSILTHDAYDGITEQGYRSALHVTYTAVLAQDAQSVMDIDEVTCDATYLEIAQYVAAMKAPVYASIVVDATALGLGVIPFGTVAGGLFGMDMTTPTPAVLFTFVNGAALMVISHGISGIDFAVDQLNLAQMTYDSTTQTLDITEPT